MPTPFALMLALAVATGALPQPPAGAESAPIAAAPKAAPVAGFKLAAYPAEVGLETAQDRQTLVIQASYPDGLTRDVTHLAEFRLANPALAKCEAGALTPLSRRRHRVSRRVSGPVRQSAGEGEPG